MSYVCPSGVVNCPICLIEEAGLTSAWHAWLKSWLKAQNRSWWDLVYEEEDNLARQWLADQQTGAVEAALKEAKANDEYNEVMQALQQPPPQVQVEAEVVELPLLEAYL